MEELLHGLAMPVLVVVDDEDELAIFLKRRIPRAGLLVFPKTGHAVNSEEPARFNHALLEFFTAVQNDRWDERDAAAIPLR